jgi:hypothetical protein
MNYQIKIAEVLNQSWADWLGEGKMVTKQLPRWRSGYHFDP